MISGYILLKFNNFQFLISYFLFGILNKRGAGHSFLFWCPISPLWNIWPFWACVINYELRITNYDKKKPCRYFPQGFMLLGNDLLFHLSAVPSALLGLTSLFGMGRGVPQRYCHRNLVTELYWFVLL